MAEEYIYNVAYAIHQKYMNADLSHDAHGIWLLAGDCLKQLIAPFDRHPLALRLTQCMVDYYSDQYGKAHSAA